MRKKGMTLICTTLWLIIMICFGFEIKGKELFYIQPDVISSVSKGRDQYLIVVANRDKIEDKVAFAKVLVEMCKENSFHSIKFSTDIGYPTSLKMKVYLERNRIDGKEPEMLIEYSPDESGKGYDIVNNEEQFDLFIDGEIYE